MDSARIYFMGLLANVDPSILNLKLEYGFEVNKIPFADALFYLSLLDGVGENNKATFTKLFNNKIISNESIYFISKTFPDLSKNDGKDFYMKDKKLVYEYLLPIMSLLRLFKEGNICIPLRYYYFFYPGPVKFREDYDSASIIVEEPFKIVKSEVKEINEFIHSVKLPVNHDYLGLALETFELSYSTEHLNLNFLNLMNSLEILFNPGKDVKNKKHNIADNAAKLLAKSKEQLLDLYNQFILYYDIRSKITHEGRSNINEDDLLILRNHVRESIKKCIKLDCEKEQLLRSLKKWDYKDGPWKIESL